MTRIKQAGLSGVSMAGAHSAYSKVAEVEGVVIAVRYVDDPKNLSKAYVEYDVKDLRTGQVYPNCRRCDQTAGIDDGEDNTLRPAQKQFGTTTPIFDPKRARLSQSDGDRVLVTCTYGAQHNAVITAVLPHSRMSYGTTRAQGFRRFQTHKGTSVETQQDGTYRIKRGSTSVTLNANETIDVVHKSGSAMHFADDGSVQVTPASGASFFVGTNGSTENMVLGQQLKAFFNALIAALLVAQYPTGLGPTGPMLPPAQTILQQLQSQLDSLLSQMSFTTAEV